MSEKRYALETVAEAIGIGRTTVYNRAQKLNIDTHKGLTAAQAKAVSEYKKRPMRKRGSLQELQAELEGMR